VQSVRLFIELRTSVSDALRSWSEFAAGSRNACHVHFEAIAPMQSRLTLELPEPAGADGVRRLLAFKAFAEEARAASPVERRASA
jgi:hypothetical protein